MKKQEIFKLQLDAYITPFVWWRLNAGPNKEWPKDLIKSESLWEWDEDVEQASTAGYFLSTPKIYFKLVNEIVDVFLMQISKNKTEEYDNISYPDYDELFYYVSDKLEDILLEESFDKEVTMHYKEVWSKLNTEMESINNIIK